MELMKLKLLLCSLLLIAVPAEAKPHWKRIAVKTAVLVGASVLQYKATTYCSRGDVERCIEGYGSRRAFNWFSIGAGAVLIPVSEKCKNEDGPKPVCYALAYGVPAAQTSFGIHDFLSYSPKEKHETNTLRSFARARVF